MEDRDRENITPTSLVIGLLLIAIGMVLILGRFLGLRLGAYLWPLFILVPGATLLLIGLLSKGPLGQPLVMVGSIVSAVGSLLFYQNITGHWQSWAYAWALVAPTSMGIGLLIYGAIHDRRDLVKTGTDLATIGLALFAGFATFFELVIGISGFGLGNLLWPILLIGVGVLFLLRALIQQRQ
jgi:hypothetical protein